jgi:DNA-binding protein YbaB
VVGQYDAASADPGNPKMAAGWCVVVVASSDIRSLRINSNLEVLASEEFIEEMFTSAMHSSKKKKKHHREKINPPFQEANVR